MWNHCYNTLTYTFEGYSLCVHAVQYRQNIFPISNDMLAYVRLTLLCERIVFICGHKTL